MSQVPLEWQPYSFPGYARRAIRDSSPYTAQVRGPSGTIYVAEATTWEEASITAIKLALEGENSNV